jgi:hypothetical protein
MTCATPEPAPGNPWHKNPAAKRFHADGEGRAPHVLAIRLYGEGRFGGDLYSATGRVPHAAIRSKVAAYEFPANSDGVSDPTRVERADIEQAIVVANSVAEGDEFSEYSAKVRNQQS